MQPQVKYIVLRQAIIILSFVLSINSFAYGSGRILGETQNLSNKQAITDNKNDLYIRASQPLMRQQNAIHSKISLLRRDYEFIFFYSSNCQHCRIFDPVLKLYSDNYGIPVKAFMVGGKASQSFPNSIIVAQEIVNQFFGRGAKISIPTLFILNKNNFHAYPVSSGALTYLELTTRMGELTTRILQNEKNS
ncbi:MAG: conjugal transfer protein TraF [Gammaproteobacteria bacterium]|nr:conjugal transfer protein TraF [Gammaproteobacteria bacterium]